MSGKRDLGPIGTALRVVVGLGLIWVAVADDGSWQLNWYEPLVGFLVLPGIMIGVGLLARHYASGPLRFTGPLGHLANLVVIVALLVNPYTGSGASLFYGVSMLVAAWRGQGRCEATVLSNLVLSRDDQVGCPLFFPVDLLEARAAQRPARDRA